MKKEEFIQIIKELKAIKKDESSLNKAFRKFDPDFNYLGFGRYETLLVKTLKSAMDDKYDYIGWWLYEDVEKTVWTDKIKWDLTTPEQLFDFLRRA